MSPDSTHPDEDSSGNEGQHRDPRILLFMQSGRNRTLLEETLGEEYYIETSTEIDALESTFDCCVFGPRQFNRVGGTVQSRRDTAKPTFLPFVLLLGPDAPEQTAVEAWQYVDDIIHLPVKKRALLARIGNLVERRQTAKELADRERELRQTVADLKLKERTMDRAPVGITIAEPGTESNPLIYANEQFSRLTEYSDVIGEDCRFLQGPETDSETTNKIRAAIEDEEPISVDVLNYRKNGQKFWNKLDIAPIENDEGNVVNFVGFQTDITERKIRERRLEVLNRVLSHNLRNKMNVIQGYVTLLRDEYAEDEMPEAITKIDRASAALLGLAEAVQKVERTLNVPESVNAILDLNERLVHLVSAFEDRFPEATFDLTIPDGRCEVAVTGLMTAIEEAIENAVKHNDGDEPRVEIRVTRRSDHWIDIEIVDNGPGVPTQELDVLREGETPLKHADRMGLWLMHWVISRAGGDFSLSADEPSGTRLEFSVPAHT